MVAIRAYPWYGECLGYLTKPLAWAGLRVFVEPLLLWKGDTVNAPSGSSDPEGSVARPGREQSRVASSHEIRDVNRPNVRAGTARAGRGLETADARVLSGNQYAALFENDEE